jgi:hypothetical protein
LVLPHEAHFDWLLRLRGCDLWLLLPSQLHFTKQLLKHEGEHSLATATGSGLTAGAYANSSRTYEQLGSIGVDITVLVQLQTSGQCPLIVPHGEEAWHSRLPNYPHVARRHGL